MSNFELFIFFFWWFLRTTFFLDQQQQQFGQPPQPGFYPHGQEQGGYPNNQGQPQYAPNYASNPPNYYINQPIPTEQPMFSNNASNYRNAEDQVDNQFAFDDQTIRKAFVRKVFLILMVSIYMALIHIILIKTFIHQNHSIGTIIGYIWSYFSICISRTNQKMDSRPYGNVLYCIGCFACYNDMHGLLFLSEKKISNKFYIFILIHTRWSIFTWSRICGVSTKRSYDGSWYYCWCLFSFDYFCIAN